MEDIEMWMDVLADYKLKSDDLLVKVHSIKNKKEGWISLKQFETIIGSSIIKSVVLGIKDALNKKDKKQNKINTIKREDKEK